MFTNFLTMLDAPMRLTQVSRLDAELFMKLYKLPPGLLTPADRDFCLDIVKRIWAGFFTRPVQNVKIDLVQSVPSRDHNGLYVYYVPFSRTGTAIRI